MDYTITNINNFYIKKISSVQKVRHRNLFGMYALLKLKFCSGQRYSREVFCARMGP